MAESEGGLSYAGFGGTFDKGYATPKGQEKDKSGGEKGTFVNVGDVGQRQKRDKACERSGGGQGHAGRVSVTGCAGVRSMGREWFVRKGRRGERQSRERRADEADGWYWHVCHFGSWDKLLMWKQDGYGKECSAWTSKMKEITGTLGLREVYMRNATDCCVGLCGDSRDLRADLLCVC